MVVAIQGDGGNPPSSFRGGRAMLGSVTALPVRFSRDPLHEGARPAVRVAEEDPGLLGTLTGTLADAARHRLVARTLWLDPGVWEPLSTDLPRRFDGWIGMLVLDGLLVR